MERVYDVIIVGSVFAMTRIWSWIPASHTSGRASAKRRAGMRSEVQDSTFISS